MRSPVPRRVLLAVTAAAVCAGCSTALNAGLGLLGLSRSSAPDPPPTVSSTYLYGPPLGLQSEALAPPARIGWTSLDRPSLLEGQEVRCRPVAGGAAQLVSAPGVQPVTSLLGGGEIVRIDIALAPFQAVRATTNNDRMLLASSLLRQSAWMGSTHLSQCARSVFAFVSFFPGASSSPVVVNR